MIGLDADVREILAAGNQAPSGENSQPWRFRVKGKRVSVHLLPERDRSPYSAGHRASYVANGAAIENMAIAASVHGYRADVRYFPDESDDLHVADIELVGAGVAPDPLARVIKDRCTNRKPFARDPLSSDDRAALEQAVSGREGVAFALAEDREEIDRLGRVGSTNEEVMLANHALHDFFFSHVSWTEEEDREKNVGFYIKTLELPPPAEAMFKLLRRWPVARALGALGFARVVAKQNAAVNASASAMAAVLIEETSPHAFVEAGRAVERLWLTATLRGLSLQPLTGIPYLELLIERGEADALSPAERARITHAYDSARKTFLAGDRRIAFMCRIGKGERPTARAIRFPLEEVVAIV